MNRSFKLLIFLFLLSGFTGLLHAKIRIKNGPDSSGRRLPRMGIFLPLSVADSPGNKAESSNILEFYKGMITANEICTAQDSGFDFHLFDHRNQVSELKKIALSGCFDNLDLIVGPVKTSLFPFLDSLAAPRKTPLFNALSQLNSPQQKGISFSIQPGMATIVNTCFEAAASAGLAGKAGIIYGPEKRDSLLAKAYMDFCLQKGTKVVLFRKVGKNSAANLSKYLAAAGLDSVSHLFVPNNEELVRVQLLSAYGLLQSKFGVFVAANWLDSPTTDPDEFAELPFYFATSEIPLSANKKMAVWRSNFIARWGNPPGRTAWKGFDLVMLLSGLWYRQGENIGSRELDIEAPVFGRCRFVSGKTDNQFVPLVKVGGNGLVLVNP